MRGAGGGRPSKPEGQRRNRNPSTARQAVQIPDDAPVVVPPPPICELSVDGMRLWGALWALPDARGWRAVDVPALSRLVWLQQSPTHWVDNRMLAEMRQLEDRFGMSPYSRQHLGEPVKPPAAGSQPAPPRRGERPADDRKAQALRLLSGETG